MSGALVARARQLVATGRCTAYGFEPGRLWVGLVRTGGRAHLTTVLVDPDAVIAKSSCTCEAGCRRAMCRHVVAASIILREGAP